MLKKFIEKYILKKLNKKVYPKLLKIIQKTNSKQAVAALALIWGILTCLLIDDCDSIQKLLEDFLD